jgi:hypothetical protein
MSVKKRTFMVLTGFIVLLGLRSLAQEVKDYALPGSKVPAGWTIEYEKKISLEEIRKIGQNQSLPTVDLEFYRRFQFREAYLQIFKTPVQVVLLQVEMFGRSSGAAGYLQAKEKRIKFPDPRQQELVRSAGVQTRYQQTTAYGQAGFTFQVSGKQTKQIQGHLIVFRTGNAVYSIFSQDPQSSRQLAQHLSVLQADRVKKKTTPPKTMTLKTPEAAVASPSRTEVTAKPDKSWLPPQGKTGKLPPFLSPTKKKEEPRQTPAATAEAKHKNPEPATAHIYLDNREDEAVTAILLLDDAVRDMVTVPGQGRNYFLKAYEVSPKTHSFTIRWRVPGEPDLWKTGGLSHTFGEKESKHITLRIKGQKPASKPQPELREQDLIVKTPREIQVKPGMEKALYYRFHYHGHRTGKFDVYAAVGDLSVARFRDGKHDVFNLELQPHIVKEYPLNVKGVESGETAIDIRIENTATKAVLRRQVPVIVTPEPAPETVFTYGIDFHDPQKVMGIGLPGVTEQDIAEYEQEIGTGYLFLAAYARPAETWHQVGLYELYKGKAWLKASETLLKFKKVYTIGKSLVGLYGAYQSFAKTRTLLKNIHSLEELRNHKRTIVDFIHNVLSLYEKLDKMVTGSTGFTGTFSLIMKAVGARLSEGFSLFGDVGDHIFADPTFLRSTISLYEEKSAIAYTKGFHAIELGIRANNIHKNPLKRELKWYFERAEDFLFLKYLEAILGYKEEVAALEELNKKAFLSFLSRKKAAEDLQKRKQQVEEKRQVLLRQYKMAKANLEALKKLLYIP